MIDFESKHAPIILDSSVLGVLAPKPHVSSWDWISKHGRNTHGQPFDVARMPWARGPCDAWDDPSIRKIVLKWGTRLGKTLLSLQLMAYAMEMRPYNGILCGPDEKLTKRTVTEKVYKVLERIPSLRDTLPIARWRSSTAVRCNSATWVAGWSGSTASLADWDALYAYCFEVDKYASGRSVDGTHREGSPLSLVDERTKDWPDHKIIYECSPSLKGKSAIDRAYQASNQCRYYVPCVHCGVRQVLKMGEVEDGRLIGGGIRFDTPDKGLDPELAAKTAVYICDSCGKEIENHHRRKMMRAGSWVAKGQRVRKDGRITGEPDRDGTIWGGQLPSFYSMQLTWGAMAEKFVRSLEGGPGELQTWVNGWEAEVWEVHKRKSNPELVGQRLAADYSRGELPEWCTWRFAAIDVQQDFFKWIACGCGPEERIAVSDWGYADSEAELVEHVLNREIAGKRPAVTWIDCGDGNRTKDVYDFCKRYSRPDRLVQPCKGSNDNCNGASYQRRKVGEGPMSNSKMAKLLNARFKGLEYFRVNPFFWEPVIDRWLYDREPGEFDSLVLPREAATDEEFLAEICNGAQSETPSKMDPDKCIWVKQDDNLPNDWRDGLKYARCAMEVKFRDNWIAAEKEQAAAQEVAVRAVAEAPQRRRPMRRPLSLRRR